ncbi:hypothetical protein FXO38_25388 [Capsicum annuum]|nr:hypothetical protein FXO38_25388 [Capsicum annuum]
MVRRIPPKTGRLKRNTDGVSKSNPGPSFITFCIRDQNGDLVVAGGSKIKDTTSLEAKAIAIRECLKYCRLNFNNQKILESDSQTMVQILNMKLEVPWSVKIVVNSIKSLMGTMSVRVVHSLKGSHSEGYYLDINEYYYSVIATGTSHGLAYSPSGYEHYMTFGVQTRGVTNIVSEPKIKQSPRYGLLMVQAVEGRECHICRAHRMEKFATTFLDKFFPLELRKAKVLEFINLKQCNMTVKNVVKKCRTTILIKEMDISRLIVHAQKIEEAKNKEKERDNNGDRIAIAPVPKFRDGNKDRAPGPKPQGSISSARINPLYQKYGKNHQGVCRADSTVCLGCGKPGHRIKDCPQFGSQGQYNHLLSQHGLLNQ